MNKLFVLKEHRLDANSVHEDDEGCKRNKYCEKLEERNLYAQMKHQPCRRYKIRAIRTPFATYGRRKLNK